MIQRLQAKRNEEGFTLIELLIVIIVLGILAAIVVFAVGSTRSDAVESSCRTSFKSAQLSAEAVNTKNGLYPAAQGDLYDSTKGGLLKEWPTSSDYTLTYAQTGSGTGYTLTVGGSKVATGTTADGCKKA